MKASEKARRARNYEPPMQIQLIAETGSPVDPDDWFSGFASALAQIWRLHHDGQLVRHIMAATNITMKHFEDTGVDEYDMSAIREAMKRSASLADKRVGR